jgi:hypothetical protein
MSHYQIAYRLSKDNAWHYSAENYSGNEAMQLAESLEAAGYEVQIKAVDSPKSIHVAPMAAAAAASHR